MPEILGLPVMSPAEWPARLPETISPAMTSSVDIGAGISGRRRDHDVSRANLKRPVVSCAI